jgi:hypothetical protein
MMNHNMGDEEAGPVVMLGKGASVHSSPFERSTGMFCCHRPCSRHCSPRPSQTHTNHCTLLVNRHCNVPYRCSDDRQLGTWAGMSYFIHPFTGFCASPLSPCLVSRLTNDSFHCTARQRKIKDDLADDQRRRLENLGFIWETAQDRAWQEKFLRLKQYKEK